MLQHSTPLYVPTLRLKEGECRGLTRLAPDVASKIEPRFVIPPPKDRDREAKRRLSQQEIVDWTGRRIGSFWPMRRAFLDVRFLFAEFGESESSVWLPRICTVARDKGSKVVPVATLSDLLGPRSEGFRLALAQDTDRQLALRVESGEVDRDLPSRVAAAMANLGISPQSCALLLDFADAELGSVDAVELFIRAALETVQSIGLWQSVIFQATNYPEKNPAEDGSSAVVPRNEWFVWKEVMQSGAAFSGQLIFGDYGADCAKFVFRSGGGAMPIRHHRYCTPTSWLVVRGRAGDKVEEAMRGVCHTILESGVFAGRDFSSADEYIYNVAHGYGGPGNATTWREINTAHHITQVIADIGEIKGFRIARRASVDRQQLYR